MQANLNQQFQKYISYCINTRGLHPQTIKSYKNVFGHFQKVMPEISEVAMLTPATMDKFFERLQARHKNVRGGAAVFGVKASTVRTYGSKLHTFFNWIVARGLIDQNPIDLKGLPNPDYSDKRALTKQEVEKIISAVTQNASNPFIYKRNIAMVYVLLFCGLRKTEFLCLRLSDVDTTKRILTVRGETSKSKFTRFIPLPPTTSFHLSEYMEQRRARFFSEEWLWLSHLGSRFTEHGLKHWVAGLVKQSGVRFHLHRFRHSFACMLGRNNVSAVKIQKLLGHVDLRMTVAYLRSMGIDDVNHHMPLLSLESL